MGKLERHPNSQYCPGAYSLHLYCKWVNPQHCFDEFPHEPEGETRAECEAGARSYGWVLHRDNTGTCPKCAKILKIGRFAGRAALSSGKEG